MIANILLDETTLARLTPDSIAAIDALVKSRLMTDAGLRKELAKLSKSAKTLVDRGTKRRPTR